MKSQLGEKLRSFHTLKIVNLNHNFRYRKSSSSSSNSPRAEKLVASPTDKLYDFSMTYDSPVTGYQQQQAQQRQALPPLPRLTSSRTDIPYQPAHKRDSVSHLTDYGNGFQTQIYHNPNAFNQGPVLFNQQPVVASPEEAEEDERAPVTEKRPSKIKRKAEGGKKKGGKKGDKKGPQKSAKYSEYDGLDLNYDASVENDGGESEGDYVTSLF